MNEWSHNCKAAGRVLLIPHGEQCDRCGMDCPNCDDLRESLHLIASTTTDPGAREEAERALSVPEPEPTEAQRVCYEAYAAIGALLFDLAEKGHPQAEKLMDNLSAARLVHKDVLPFADASGVTPSLKGGSDAEA